MPHTQLPSWYGTVGQLVADLPNGFGVTPLQENHKEILPRYSMFASLRWIAADSVGRGLDLQPIVGPVAGGYGKEFHFLD
jgi:hypothetical protein